MIKRTYLECACWSPCHTFSLWRCEDTNQVYISLHLTQFPWYQRIWVALKYVFGYSNQYGHFEEVVLDKDTQLEFKRFL